jgi:primosomal protein N' (replication factor Y)
MLRRTLGGYLAGLEDLTLLGPAPATVARVNNRYRYRMLLSCSATRRVRDTVAHVVREFTKDKQFRGLHVYADADPYEI